MSWLKNLVTPKEKIPPLSLNDGNFQREVKQYRGACLVDVWGPNCAPCTQLAPVIEELATRYKGKVKVCELNAASAPRSAARLSVRGTPTIVAFKNGAEIGRVVGFKPLSFLSQMVETEFAEYVSGEVQPVEASPAERLEAGAGTDGGGRKLNKKAMKKALKKQRKK